jgi:hypothetical protein
MLLELSAPSMPDARRQEFERRIIAGERITPAEVKKARGPGKIGAPRRST